MYNPALDNHLDAVDRDEQERYEDAMLEKYSKLASCALELYKRGFNYKDLVERFELKLSDDMKVALKVAYEFYQVTQ